jgi:hypothetical protein
VLLIAKSPRPRRSLSSKSPEKEQLRTIAWILHDSLCFDFSEGTLLVPVSVDRLRIFWRATSAWVRPRPWHHRMS